MSNKLTRRNILKLLSYSSAGTLLSSPLAKLALAQSSGSTSRIKPFILEIQLGSWCGFSTGLVQPVYPNKWEKGTIFAGSTEGSPNPLVNQHFKVQNQIFHNYSKPLSRLTDDLSFGAVNPRSLGHNAAMVIQSKGGLGNASWLAGVAQQNTSVSDPVALTAGFKIFRNGATSRVINLAMGGVSMEPLRRVFMDSPELFRAYSKSRELKSLWDAKAKIGGSNYLPAELDAAFKKSLASFEDNLWNGIPEAIRTGSALIAEIDGYMTRARIDQIIDEDLTDNNDGLACKQVYDNAIYGSMFNQLKTAAACAVSGVCDGMQIQIPLSERQDLHNVNSTSGSPSVRTARSATQMWAQLAVFWEYIKEKGLADHVLVIAYHEFSRTSLNGVSLNGVESVISGGTRTPIVSIGNDHAPVAGYMFLGGRVPGGTRFGGVTEGYSLLGSSGVAGIPDPNVQPYLSTDLVPSMLMRCYPELFPSDDLSLIRSFWSEFRQPIQNILDA